MANECKESKPTPQPMTIVRRRRRKGTKPRQKTTVFGPVDWLAADRLARSRAEVTGSVPAGARLAGVAIDEVGQLANGTSDGTRGMIARTLGLRTVVGTQ